MNFYSLNHTTPVVDFKTATLIGQAPDRGLYFPETIPAFDTDMISNLKKLSDEEIAFSVISPYVNPDITETELRQIVKETISFPIPLKKINDQIYSLELYHGPTLAFKDVGARFMSRCLGYFAKKIDQRIVVLVATSGDTGGAVANGFFDVPGIDVVILYPSGKVSPVQEKQLTTPGKNIHALEVNGNFDQCQSMVKQAFTDEDLKKLYFLTSANSINVARWLPQQFYYLLALKQWPFEQPPVISVPSGNFGNICAGLLAQKSGMPADHFIAAVNINDTVPRFFESQRYEPHTAKATLSNAMDVSDPSNFVRVQEIFGNVFDDLNKKISSMSYTDDQTETTIKKVYDDYGYLLDPHGAVSYLGLEEYLQSHPGKKGFILETAHPVKFPESVERITGIKIPIPEHVLPIMSASKKSVLIEPEYSQLKKTLQSMF